MGIRSRRALAFPQLWGGQRQNWGGGGVSPWKSHDQAPLPRSFHAAGGQNSSATRSWEGKLSLGFRVNTCLVLGGVPGGAHGLAAAAGGGVGEGGGRFPSRRREQLPRVSLPAGPRWVCGPSCCPPRPAVCEGRGPCPRPRPHGPQEDSGGTQAQAGGRWRSETHPPRPPAQPCPGVTQPGQLWVERVPPAPQLARAGQEPAQLAPAQQIILEALAGTGTSQNSHIRAVGPRRGREQPAPLQGLHWQPLPRRGRRGWPPAGAGGSRPRGGQALGTAQGDARPSPAAPSRKGSGPGVLSRGALSLGRHLDGVSPWPPPAGPAIVTVTPPVPALTPG